MKNRVAEQDIAKIAKDITALLTQSKIDRKDLYFICGSTVKNTNSARSIVAEKLSQDRLIQLLYPEKMFDELLVGQSNNSLLDFEALLASSVDVVVLFPESPGSFAELGAFASNEDLCNRLICIPNSEYERDKSFINHGPLRLIKKSQYGCVIPFDYTLLNSPASVDSLIQDIKKRVKKIKQKNPPKQALTNILFSEYFVLYSCCVFGDIYFDELYLLLNSTSNQSQKVIKHAIWASIHNLIKKRFMGKTIDKYEISDAGFDFVQNVMRKSNLVQMDKIRLEVVSVLNRPKCRYNNVY